MLAVAKCKPRTLLHRMTDVVQSITRKGGFLERFFLQTTFLTFPVRFEVTVDWWGLDLTQSSVALRHGSSFMHGKGRRGQPHQVKVMRPRAHGNVEILGVVVGFLSVDQGRGTGVHGDVVVLRVGAVGAGHHCLGLLRYKREEVL